MNINYYKEYSSILNRDMEYKVFGDTGRICLAFPAQNGRFYDFENFGMVDCMSAFIESGKVQLVLVDSLDWESWTCEWRSPRERIEMQEKWFSYVTDELLPTLKDRNDTREKAITTGCSMGAVHAAKFFFRRPDLFEGVIALSGLYNAGYFFHGYMDDLVYGNSPASFLRNMPADHPYMDIYAKSKIIICIGQGPWENETLDGTRELDWVLKPKNIPAWVDYWGYDVSHDWVWWRKQLPYFLGQIEAFL